MRQITANAGMAERFFVYTIYYNRLVEVKYEDCIFQYETL